MSKWTKKCILHFNTPEKYNHIRANYKYIFNLKHVPSFFILTWLPAIVWQLYEFISSTSMVMTGYVHRKRTTTSKYSVHITLDMHYFNPWTCSRRGKNSLTNKNKKKIKLIVTSVVRRSWTINTHETPSVNYNHHHSHWMTYKHGYCIKCLLNICFILTN